MKHSTFHPNTTLNLIATCPNELIDLLKEEIIVNGGSDVTILYKALRFKLKFKDFYKINLNLRVASKIFLVVAEIPNINTYDELKTQASKIKWNQFFDKKCTFKVEAIQTNRGPMHMTKNHISKAVREGLQLFFAQHYHTHIPQVNLKNPDIIIMVWLGADHCTISLDCSKHSLHKRGYRSESNIAPLSETLACAILKFAGYDGSQTLLDPMCGSGTIPIEASMLALNICPLKLRPVNEFGFYKFKFFDKQEFLESKKLLTQKEKICLSHPIYGSDLNSWCIKIAKSNAQKANVLKHILFTNQRFERLTKPYPTGLIVSNLPYGIRLNDVTQYNDLKTFYKTIGDTLKKNFSGWRAALLVNAQNKDYKFIGLRVKKRISLMNAQIPTKLLIFDIY